MSGSNCKTHMMKDTNREITKSCGVKIASITKFGHGTTAYEITHDVILPISSEVMSFFADSERGEANEGTVHQDVPDPEGQTEILRRACGNAGEDTQV